MFVGPAGTGKSVIVLDYLNNLPKEKFLANVLNFSAWTVANTVQDIIISKLDKYINCCNFYKKNIITYKILICIGEEEEFLDRLLGKNACCL